MENWNGFFCILGASVQSPFRHIFEEIVQKKHLHKMLVSEGLGDVLIDVIHRAGKVQLMY